MAITYPVPASTFPSAEWWANLAASTQASIDAAQNAAVSTAAANTSSAVASAQAALQAAIDGKAPTVHTHTRAQISDATTLGRTLMGAADANTARGALEVAPRTGGLLAGETNLDELRNGWNVGVFQLSSSANYPGKPADLVGAASLEVMVSSLAVVTQQITQAGSSRTWRRTWLSSAWSPWQRLGVMGDNITVDTSVGTRVTVGGVMVYGDTGWRDVSGALENGWTADLALIRRRPGFLDIFFTNLSGTSSSTVLNTNVSGWRPGGSLFGWPSVRIVDREHSFNWTRYGIAGPGPITGAQLVTTVPCLDAMPSTLLGTPA